jgi:hypothetical protein
MKFYPASQIERKIRTLLTMHKTVLPAALKYKLTPYHGRAIAQAVSRWLPTAAARDSSTGLVMWDLWCTKWRWGRFSPSTSVSPVNLHSTSCSTIILRVLRFPLPIFIPPVAPQSSSSIIWGCTIGQKWPQYLGT